MREPGTPGADVLESDQAETTAVRIAPPQTSNNTADQRGRRSGAPLSKATLYHPDGLETVLYLVRRTAWLQAPHLLRGRRVLQPFGQGNADSRGDPPGVFQRSNRFVIIQSMPATTEIERRDRALIAFTILTGARDGAIASFKLKHIDIADGKIDQEAREVRTKFSKPFSRLVTTYGRWWSIGSTICGEISYGVWTTRCFLPRKPRWGAVFGLKRQD